MTSEPISNPGYRFRPRSSATPRGSHVFGLSLRDMELILAEPGVAISHEVLGRVEERRGAA